ncbi:MAG: sulfotransferase domain-containing protein [Methylovulum sp.]|nr:sulfotransferase domain-containing protein [Methylovulum sp.]
MKKVISAVRNLSKVGSSGDRKESTIKGYVERVDTRGIHGWVVDLEQDELNLSLQINDEAYPVSPNWRKRADVVASLGDERFTQPGFSIEIPESLADVFTQACRQDKAISVFANGVSLPVAENVFANIVAKKSVKTKLGKPLEVVPSTYDAPPKLEKLFVCIGAQKSGTSWLFENLSLDRRFVYCPFVKEIHYFDYVHKQSKHLNNWRANFLLKLAQGNEDRLKPLLSAWLSGDKYPQLSKEATVKDRMLARRFAWLINEPTDDWYSNLLRISGRQEFALDITPDYAVIGRQGFEHIKRIANQVKVLFILRNPSERAWSGLLQGKKKTAGGIAGYLENKTTTIDAMFAAATSGADVGGRNNYLATLIALEEVGFLDGQVLIKFYDELESSPEDFIADIYQFLEMPLPDMALFSETLRAKVYATQKTVMPPELKDKLDDYYADMVKEINERFIGVPGAWLHE